mmetsp:Transcript_6132/g.17592  ORF Transcript_6132/g.17592 Transcript_6132/m.17592 type:complete len:243 (+) Transcript_6132:612-1340(+)
MVCGVHSLGSPPCLGAWLLTMSTKTWCQRMSSVSSGWKAVANRGPDRTATATWRTPCACSTSSSDNLYSDNTSTSLPHSKIPGARMNTARYGVPASPDPFWNTGGQGSAASKLFSCAPKKLRCTRQSRPPSSACPPFFMPVARSARKIMPAQVPHTGRDSAQKARRSGMRPHRSATLAMVVLSPPGIMRPDTLASCSLVRTSTGTTPGSRRRDAMCSRNDPCSASTPMRHGSMPSWPPAAPF